MNLYTTEAIQLPSLFPYIKKEKKVIGFLICYSVNASETNRFAT